MTDTTLWVVGVDATGVERVRARLAHGDDPVRLLAREGYATSGPDAVTGTTDPHTVTVFYPVVPSTVAAAPEEEDVPRDPGIRLAWGKEPVVRQRIVVYAVVTSSRGVLLTENSALTNAAGTWALAGGGLDHGELPEAALHREVWEEAGQRIEVTDIAVVTTRHWVGRAPNGVVEDFHAVRLVYRATCPEPSDPVVHDVDGTTAAAAWVPPDDVDGLPLALGTREILTHLSRDDTHDLSRDDDG